MTSRAHLPERVRALLTAPANVAIHGSPGSGKSWIGDRVKLLLDDSEQSVIRVDLSTVPSGRDVFCEVLAGLGGDGAFPAPIRDVWRQVRTVLESSDRHFVVLLDQFDRVLQFDDALDFLLLFRELVHRPESLRCTALMISRRSLQSIETKVSGISTLAGVCYTQYLGSLLADDLDDLGPGAGGLSDSQKMECLTWSGGHPALAKYWLTTRPDVSPDPSGELERAKVANRVVDHLSDLGLLDAAAQYVLGPVVDDLLFERQELELLGVLAPSVEETATAATLSKQDHFRAALRYRTWSMNPWGVLGHAEVRLRGLIDNVLTEKYGTEWVVPVVKKSRSLQSVLADAQSKQARDSRMFSRQAPWLSYTYPGDLWQLIQQEWASFVSVFNSRDKAYWRGVMTGLSQYRAPLAHGRAEVLGDVERNQCRLFAEVIIAKISAHEMSRTQNADVVTS